jgi:hypothetical protein
MISAVPVPGEPGHYALSFPLRPGATKFAFNYDLPYDGHAKFQTRRVCPVQQLAVMIPPSMKFTSQSTDFQILPGGNNNYQVEVAKQVSAGEGPGFEISGMGALPALQARVQSPPKPKIAAVPPPAPSAASSAGARTQVANALGALPASRTSSPSSRRKRWVLGASAVLALGTCGFLLWRRAASFANAKAVGEQGQSSASLEALKEELLQLEMERLRGRVSGEEYASAKRALCRRLPVAS